MANIRKDPRFIAAMDAALDKAFQDAKTHQKMAHFLPGLKAMDAKKVNAEEAGALIAFGAFVGALAALEANRAAIQENGGKA